MISYEEALLIARSNKEGIDNCTEYEDCYLFGATKDNGKIGPGPIAVYKADGRIAPMIEFVMNEHGKKIKEFDI